MKHTKKINTNIDQMQLYVETLPLLQKNGVDILNSGKANVHTKWENTWTINIYKQNFKSLNECYM